jgi:serine phosphatase RsbU (regulator of sigma subunit)
LRYSVEAERQDVTWPGTPWPLRGPRVHVVSVGHPLPFVVRADGTVAETGTPGTLLGILADVDAVEDTVELGADDAEVLFTDG